MVGADMCAGWTIGGGVRIITGQSSSHAELQNPFTGNYRDKFFVQSKFSCIKVNLERCFKPQVKEYAYPYII